MCSVDMSAEVLFEQSRSASHATDHYVFHFQPGSLAEKEIEHIAASQERAFARICHVLNLCYPERINYYFSDSPLEIGQIFWGEGASCNGCAVCGANKIYAVYTENLKCIGAHEDTHLISYLIGAPQSDFLSEGLAMFFHELWWGIPNEVWTSFYISYYPDLSVKKLLDNDFFVEYGCTIAYPVSGAFTKYLIDVYGMNRYIELYKYDGNEYDDQIQAIYGCPLSELEKGFWDNLRNVVFDAAALEEKLKREGN